MRRRGFSLVEVIVSGVLLLSGLAAILLAATVAFGLNEHQKRVGQAVVIAEQQMENLLLLFPNSPALIVGRHPGTGFTSFDETGAPGGSAFRSSYVVSAADPVGQQIVLTIEWDERGRTRSFDLVTVR
jgi:type II secretory pathway pseudopilin PulG